ncbi:MAG: putative Zn-dependent protease [Candidatus Endobugula sp.]|jgi:predicted Zn-dependent protease
MCYKKNKFRCLQWMSLVFFFSFSLNVKAEDGDFSPVSLDDQLLTLITTVTEKEKAIINAKKQLKKEKDEDLIKQIQQQILIDEDIVKGTRAQFTAISAGGEKVFVERKKIQKDIHWQEDLEAIFSPLVEQLKEISERPKIIEELEQDIVYWVEREEALNRAVNYTKTTQNTVSNKLVVAKVKNLLAEAEKQYATAGQKLALLQAELMSIRADDNPLWKNIIGLIKSFAASMLYYFIIALFFGFIVYQAVALLARLPRLMIDKRQPKRYVFAVRTIKLIKHIIGFSLGVTAYLVVLYGSGQWILLVVSLFILIGIILSLKSLVPTYIVEIRTLLNLGSIRQDERVVFDGLVWKINLIDVYTHLHNPALDAHLRVPIDKLITLSSRPYHKNEPWFPTRTGDIVLLEDETYGEVKHQSVDVVEVNQGGSTYSYPTLQFLSSRPRNLSKGFTVYEIFGFDYSHQQESTNTMLSIYSDSVEEFIKASSVGEYCTAFKVEFDKAASSSLDFKVLAKFSGEAAKDYHRISRIIQKASVDVANSQGWVIPFEQINIHQA